MAALKWTVKNPYSGETLGEAPLLSAPDLGEKLRLARQGFEVWRRAKAYDRALALENAAARLEQRKESFIQALAVEAGKPLAFAKVEVERAVQNLKLASFEARSPHGELNRLDTLPNGRSGFGIIERVPVGVVLGITPFNFPVNLTIHKIAPALASGCSVVIKPSPFTPLITLRLAELFQDLPEGVLQILPVADERMDALTRSKEIAMVSFTGSTRIGHLIRDRNPDKPVTLELGGNAWVIVDESTDEADFPKIAKKIAGGAYGYAGQSCISVQNVLVHASRAQRLRALLEQETANCKTGSPLEEGVTCGPVINAAAFDRLSAILNGRKRLGLNGADDRSKQLIRPSFVELGDVSSALNNELVQEEIFGPAFTLTSYTDASAAIHAVNSGRYGLQCGVYTRRLSFAERCFRELDVGGVIVNDVSTTRFDDAPYGGLKDSGEGREGVRYAMEEMTVRKFMALSSEIL